MSRGNLSINNRGIVLYDKFNNIGTYTESNDFGTITLGGGGLSNISLLEIAVCMKTLTKHNPNELVKLLDITNAIGQSLDFSILSSQNFSTEWYLKSLNIRSFIIDAKTIDNIEITNAFVSYVRGNFSYDFRGRSSYRISKITGYPS